LSLLTYLGLRAACCPRCRSTRHEERTRVERRYGAGERQAYESTAGWVYGYQELLVRFRHCLDCEADFREHREVIGRAKGRGARRSSGVKGRSEGAVPSGEAGPGPHPAMTTAGHHTRT
jgi:hypothetical protein